MAFQDFDLIQERRRVEKSRKFKRKITIGIVSILVLLVIVGAAFAGLVLMKKHPDEKKREDGNYNSQSESAPSTTKATPDPSSSPSSPSLNSSKAEPAMAIKILCASTDYQKTCETTLLDAVKKNKSSGSLWSPAELLQASMATTSKELDKVIQSATAMKTDDPMKKAAIDDCITLLNDAKDELNSSIATADGNNNKKTTTSGSSPHDDLNNWLSAVMSYQQTCIDGIPDGEEKNLAEKSLQISKELTSNSLAMVSQIASLLGSAPKRRRLLSLKVDDSLPTWMDHEQRRALRGGGAKLTPDSIVAKDGTGNFTAISAALAAIPQDRKGRYVIYVKPGIYEENVIVNKQMVNVTIYGDGSQKSIVTGNKNFVDGVPTFQTATFVAMGEGFMAHSIGFRNTAGPEKHQAVAIRVQSDRSIFLNCRMEGYQDTLYAQTHRQFYRSCYITGTIDFIFGDAAAIFQNCMIYVRKPMENQQNIVTAQGRVDKHETTGIVLQNCRILPDPILEPEKSRFSSYLGRPWKEYSRTIIMETEIGDLIHPDGWLPWSGDFALKTLYYGEYNNKGAGAPVISRVKWPGYRILKRADALKFTVGSFLQGDIWLKGKEIPLHLGLFT